MTTSDYELIATTIREHIEDTKALPRTDEFANRDERIAITTLHSLTACLAYKMRRHDPDFKYARFCNMSGIALN